MGWERLGVFGAGIGCGVLLDRGGALIRIDLTSRAPSQIDLLNDEKGEIDWGYWELVLAMGFCWIEGWIEGVR